MITSAQYLEILARLNRNKVREPNESVSTEGNQARGVLPDAKQCERTETLAGRGEGEAQSTGCVPVRFTLYRLKLLDVDAKYASVKDLLDCLVASGIVAGDKEGQVSLEVRQEKVSKREEERTEIVIGNAAGQQPPQNSKE